MMTRAFEGLPVTMSTPGVCTTPKGDAADGGLSYPPNQPGAAPQKVAQTYSGLLSLFRYCTSKCTRGLAPLCFVSLCLLKRECWIKGRNISERAFLYVRDLVAYEP